MNDLKIVDFVLPVVVMIAGIILITLSSRKAETLPTGEEVVKGSPVQGLIGFSLLVVGFGWAAVLIPWGVMLAQVTQ